MLVYMKDLGFNPSETSFSMKAKVSVIMTCYNEGHFVPEAVASIEAQTWVHRVVEIIVVDDGSKDDSVQMLKSFAAMHPLVRIVSQENKGLPAARNVAIRQARGDYIAILDADDLWLPEKLEKQLTVLDENSSIGVSYTDFFYGLLESPEFRERVRCRSLRPGEPNNLENYFVDDAPMIPSTLVLRRSAIERVGTFDEHFRHGEDNEMCIRLLEAVEPSHVPEPLLIKRRRANSLGADKVRSLPYFERVTEKAVRLYPRLLPFEGKRMARRIAKTGQYMETKGDFSGARNYYKMALKKDQRFYKVYILWILTFFPVSLANLMVNKIKSVRHG